MDRYSSRLGPGVVLASLLLALALLAPLTAALQAEAQAVVLSPDSRPYGRTYGEWGAAWWQWVYSIQTPVNPLLEGPCGVGQSGPVFFLVGNFGGSSTRTCTVPSGRALFIPLLTWEDNPIEWQGTPGRKYTALCQPSLPRSTPPPWHLSDGYKYVRVNGADLMTSLFASVDGIAVSPAGYRAPSQPFNITLPPPPNIESEFFCYAGASSTIAPVVADGYYLMLAPLPSRTSPYNIHFGGTTSTGFSVDVSYSLTVLP